MKLEIELVPKTCWYENLRKVLPKKEWNKIRNESYKRANHKCEICGHEGKLNCHEKWSYGDEKNIQKLEGFQALCDKCHNLKHIGFVNVQISSGKWKKSVMEDLIKHFIEINQVTFNEFKDHVKKAFEVWQERSKKDWITELGEFKKLIKE